MPCPGDDEGDPKLRDEPCNPFIFSPEARNGALQERGLRRCDEEAVSITHNSLEYARVFSPGLESVREV
jgi:hypothetical protein